MNKRGVTLVETIVAIALIAVVVIFIYNLIISVKDNNDSKIKSATNVLNKVTIIKDVQSYFEEVDEGGNRLHKLVKIENCSTSWNWIRNRVLSNVACGKHYYCVNFIEAQDNSPNTDYNILAYYTNTNGENIIGFYPSDQNYQATRLITDLAPDDYYKDEGMFNGECINNAVCAFMVNIPVRDINNNNYDININMHFAAHPNLTPSNIINRQQWSGSLDRYDNCE